MKITLRTVEVIFVQIITEASLLNSIKSRPRIVKGLRESIGMNRREFSEHTGIPIRTLEDWEAGRRTPPEYVPRLLAYMLKYEELVKRMEMGDRNDRN